MKQLLRLGTRGSPLALWQADHITELLLAAHPGLTIERVVIKTEGDRVLDRPLIEIGGKGLFIKELEEAMLDGRIDFAVHSLKDMPGAQPEGLVLDAFPTRAEPFDVMVFRQAGMTLATLPAGARIGTGSIRRSMQLLRYRADLSIVGIRGNVGTRLSKLSGDDGLDAVVLAEAGLSRLGLLDGLHWERLGVEVSLPAPSQGILGIQARSDDAETRALLAPLDDSEARLFALAERACMLAVGGDCKTPFGAFATRSGDGLRIEARLMDEDGWTTEGSRMVILRDDPAAQAEELGRRLGENILERHRARDGRPGRIDGA